MLLNDADAAIVAEVWGRDSKDLYRSAKNIAMITIGTGSISNILPSIRFILFYFILSTLIVALLLN